MRELGFEAGEFHGAAFRSPGVATNSARAIGTSARIGSTPFSGWSTRSSAIHRKKNSRERLEAVRNRTGRRFATSSRSDDQPVRESSRAVIADLKMRGAWAGSSRWISPSCAGSPITTGSSSRSSTPASRSGRWLGGGRYDGLLSVITDGSTDLCATGFAMGDCVIAELIEETPQALARSSQAWQPAPVDLRRLRRDRGRRGTASRSAQARQRPAGRRPRGRLLVESRQDQQAVQGGRPGSGPLRDRGGQRVSRSSGSRTSRPAAEESIPPNANPGRQVLKARLDEPRRPPDRVSNDAQHGSFIQTRLRLCAPPAVPSPPTRPGRPSACPATAPHSKMRTHHLQRTPPGTQRTDCHPDRLGEFAPRPRGGHLHRPARPRGADAMRFPARGVRRGRQALALAFATRTSCRSPARWNRDPRSMATRP